MVRGIDYGAYDLFQVGQLEALQGLSQQGHPLLTHPLLNFLTHVPGSANIFEHCGYVRALAVCACVRVVHWPVGFGGWEECVWIV